MFPNLRDGVLVISAWSGLKGTRGGSVRKKWKREKAGGEVEKKKIHTDKNINAFINKKKR